MCRDVAQCRVEGAAYTIPIASLTAVDKHIQSLRFIGNRRCSSYRFRPRRIAAPTGDNVDMKLRHQITNGADVELCRIA